MWKWSAFKSNQSLKYIFYFIVVGAGADTNAAEKYKDLKGKTLKQIGSCKTIAQKNTKKNVFILLFQKGVNDNSVEEAGDDVETMPEVNGNYNHY